MKKSGFSWSKCWVSVQAQQVKRSIRSSGSGQDNNNNGSKILLTWQPTSAKPSKACI